MENKTIKDPREEGVGGLRGLNRNSDNSNEEYAKALSAFRPDFTATRAQSTLNTSAVENIGNKYEGYGESIFDNNAVYEGQLEDLNELRAQEQPWYSQIAAGTAKMGVYAGTTFADGIIGTLAGIVNILGNLGEITESDNPLRELGNKFINNPISVGLQSINEWSEKALPNYYSKEELESPWYKNIFTANTLADKLIKNAGFMIGAAYSGKVSAGMLSKAMGLKAVRDAFKGMTVVTKTGEKLDKIEDIIKAYKVGDAYVDGVQLTEQLAKNAKRLRNAEASLKVVGAVNAALGESRIEAISNSKKFGEYYGTLLYKQYQSDINNIEGELFDEHPEWFTFQPQGSLETGFRYNRVLKPEYIEEWNKRKLALDQKYQDSLKALKQGTTSMSNTTFLWNMLLLSATDLYQFGKFFAGGYNTGKLATGIVKDGKKDIGEIIKRGARIPGVIISEGPIEEMGQSLISESAGLHQAAKLNQFYGKAVDPEASEELTNSLNAVVQGFKNTYGNIDAWEEGFIGMLTAGIGMPTISRVNTKNKNNEIISKWKLGWNSEVYNAGKELYEDLKNSDLYIKEYNNIITDPKFKNYYQGLVRHNAYQKDKDKALQEGDKYAFKQAEHGQLINDFLIFERADRLDELTELIDSFGGELTEEDIKTIREQSVKQDTGKSIFDGKSDDEIKEHINKQVEDIKSKLEKYKKISTDLKTLYGETIQDDYLAELVYGFTAIDDIETRAKELFETINKTFRDKGIEIDKEGQIDFNNIQELLSNVTSEDNNLIDEINQLIANKNLSVQKRNALIASRILKRVNENKDNEQSPSLKRYIREALKRIEKNKDKLLSPLDIQILNEQLIDLAKLQAQRINFIDTYNSISNNPELFAKENSELLEDLKNQANKKLVDAALIDIKKSKNLKEFRDIINKKYIRNKREIYNIIKSGEDEELKKYAENDEQLEKSTRVLTDIIKSLNTTPENVSAVNIIQDAFENSESVEEALSTIKDVSNDIIPEVKNAIEDILNKYQEQLKNKEALNKDKQQQAQPLQKPAEKKKETKKPEEQQTSQNSNPTPDLFAGTEEEISKSNDNNTSPTQQSKEDLDSVNSIIQELQIKPLDELKQIAENGYEELSEEDNKAIKETARLIYNEKVLPVAGADESIEQEDTNVLNFETAKQQLLRSWVETEYDFNGLKDRTRRMAIRRSNPLVNALSDLGVYQFVDNGHLADMLSKNSELPIHIVVSSNPVFENSLLLAVELEEGNNGINPIIGNDGKKYQVVGIVGLNSQNPNSQSIYHNLIRTVMDKYDEFKNSNSYDSSQLYISPLSTKVTHIYSGRMVKSTTENPEVTFRDLTKEFMRERPVKFGVCYPNFIFKTPTIDGNETIVQPNLNNTNPREGSVYLMVKEADGRWYPKAVRLKRFTQSEYPLDVYGNTPIMNRIKNAIRILVNPNESQYKKALAKFELESLIIFPKDNDLVFSKEGNILSIKGLKNDLIGNVQSIDEAVNNVIDALMDETLNLRFALNTYETIESGYIDDILESGIIETDLYQPSNVNASFDIAPIDDFGNPIVDKETIIVGHTGTQGINNTIISESIYNNGIKYEIFSEGVIKKENGEVVQDRNKIQEILFQSQVNRGIINPIEGNKKLYIGVYEDGTKFGIINNKVITGPLLEQMIDKANKAVKRQKRKETLTKEKENLKENKGQGDLFASTDEIEAPKQISETKEDLTNDLFADYTKDETPEPTIKKEEIKKQNTTTDVKSEDKSNKFTLTDSFEKSSESKSSEDTVKAFAMKQRQTLKELKFKNVQEFIDFCKDSKNKLPNLDTINTQEDFDKLVDLVKECRL